MTAKMVEVVIDSVRVSLTNQQRIVILRDVNQERYLPIWIGAYEAEAITISLQEIELARPQTHDLMKNLLAKLDAQLLRVEVISLQDDVFYGNLIIQVNGTQHQIDSRPSDALALAVRAHVPILVSEEIMVNAGIIPERDFQKEDSLDNAEDKGDESLEEKDDERLSVFENFLDNLNISSDNQEFQDMDDEDDEDEDEEDDTDDEEDLPQDPLP